jgi:hypothetical protein
MNTMTQEQFEQLDDYNKYVTQYQNLLDCDDGSWQSSQHIAHWLNHTSADVYGERNVEYYQRMMIQFYDHTPEDFMD